LVAATVTTEVGDTLFLEAEDPAILTASGYLQGKPVIQGWYLHLVSQSRLSEVYRQFIQDVVTISLKELMFSQRKSNIKVPRGTSVSTNIPFTAESNLNAIIDASRHLNGDLARLALLSLTFAVRAGIGYDSALTTTLAAGSYIYELAEYAALSLAHLPRTIADRASFGLAPWLASGAMTNRAYLSSYYFHLLLTAENRLLKGNSQAIMQVVTSLRPSTSCCASTAEEGFKDVPKASKVKAFKTSATKPLGSGMSKSVVGSTLLRIAENLVGLINLLKPLLSPVILVAIRMGLHRQLPERLLDLGRGGVLVDAENIIVIALIGH